MSLRPSSLSAPIPALSLSPKDERSISEPSRGGSTGERGWMDGPWMKVAVCGGGGGGGVFSKVTLIAFPGSGFLGIDYAMCAEKLLFIWRRISAAGRITRPEITITEGDTPRLSDPLRGITAANGQIVPTLQFQFRFGSSLRKSKHVRGGVGAGGIRRPLHGGLYV